MQLAAVRRLALALPEVTQAPHFHYDAFRVGGKIFVTVPPGGDCIHVFVDDEDRERALALASACMEKLLWGGKVVGLRVALAQAPPALVGDLVRQAWRRKAPRRLHAALD